MNEHLFAMAINQSQKYLCLCFCYGNIPLSSSTSAAKKKICFPFARLSLFDNDGNGDGSEHPIFHTKISFCIWYIDIGMKWQCIVCIVTVYILYMNTTFIRYILNIISFLVDAKTVNTFRETTSISHLPYGIHLFFAICICVCQCLTNAGFANFIENIK